MRALRYFMAGLSMPAAVGLLLAVALFAVLVLHQIIWLFVRGRGALPLDVGIEAAFVTVLVAGPLIAFSQDVIRLLSASREKMKALTLELADARDMLEAKVAQRTAELSAANDALSRINETLIYSLANLRVAKDQAQAANTAKSHFLANVSHELRTPLNAILGFSEVIRDDLLGPETAARYRDYAADIHSSGEHLLQLVSDLLDMSRIEAEKLDLHESEVDIVLTINTALKLVGQNAAKIGVAFTVDLVSDPPALVADEIRVKQVLLNLLSNAVKFSYPSGTIRIAVTIPADGGLAISVADTGIGMTEAGLRAAVEPFRQLDGPLARKYDGTGLGLPLAVGLMNLHGGSLTLASVPDFGTTATMTFPPARVRIR
jgi:two-component system cell cycle sensor histidine kinase PleC